MSPRQNCRTAQPSRPRCHQPEMNMRKDAGKEAAIPHKERCRRTQAANAANRVAAEGNQPHKPQPQTMIYVHERMAKRVRLRLARRTMPPPQIRAGDSSSRPNQQQNHGRRREQAAQRKCARRAFGRYAQVKGLQQSAGCNNGIMPPPPSDTANKHQTRGCESTETNASEP